MKSLDHNSQVLIYDLLIITAKISSVDTSSLLSNIHFGHPQDYLYYVRNTEPVFKLVNKTSIGPSYSSLSYCDLRLKSTVFFDDL